MPLRQASRFPLEDRGPPLRNETGFGSGATSKGSAPGFKPSQHPKRQKRHRQRDTALHGSTVQIASLPLRGISFRRFAAKGNGDGRIRTDDPLLAKQVLSH
jgi:hypothetical protein